MYILYEVRYSEVLTVGVVYRIYRLPGININSRLHD